MRPPHLSLGIGQRLFAAFGLTTLLLIVVGSFSALRLQALDAELGQVLELRMPRLALLNEILADVDELGQASRDALLVDNADAAKKHLSEVQTKRTRIGEGLERLKGMFDESDQAGQNIRVELEEQSSGFLVGMVKFTREIAAGRLEQAKRTLLDGLEPKRLGVRTSIQSYQRQQTEALGQARGAATARYQQSLYAIAGLSIAAIAVSMLLGWVITRTIVNPLRQAVAIADGVANGHFDQQFSDHRDDETGQLLASLARLQERVRAFITGQAELVRQHRELGATDARIDIEPLPGAYRELGMHTNELVESNGNETTMFIAVIDRYSTGDFTAEMPGLPGKKAALTDAARRMKLRLLATTDGINRAVADAARGELGSRIDTSRNDLLFPDLLDACNSLIELFAHVVTDATRIFAALERGDLTARVEGDYEGAFAELKSGANRGMEQLATLIEEIRRGAEAIDGAAGEIAQGNADLASRTEQQAASLEQTSASMGEITSTVKQNASSTHQANELAEQAAAIAGRGGASVQRVVRTLGEMADSSKRIHEIVGVIDGIAFQTNILALNAAVEAARAGEQGRGFAVVATEVRSLAQRSAGAAKEIKVIIDEAANRTKSGADQVGEAGAQMEEIVVAVNRLTAIIGTITAAGEAQGAGIEQINHAVAHIDNMTQQNAALVEEATAAAESLHEQANGLVNAVSAFRTTNDQGHGQRADPKHPNPLNARKPSSSQSGTAPRIDARAVA